MRLHLGYSLTSISGEPGLSVCFKSHGAHPELVAGGVAARGPSRHARGRRSAMEPTPRWTTIQARENSAKGPGSRSKARGSQSKAKLFHELWFFARST